MVNIDIHELPTGASVHLAWNGTKKRTRLFGRHLKGFNILWKKGQATVSSRITNHSEMFIDLIVTNREDLVKQKDTCPLGISDHDMIYATLSTSIPRDPPKIIKLPSRTLTNLTKGTFKVTLPVAFSRMRSFWLSHWCLIWMEPALRRIMQRTRTT